MTDRAAVAGNKTWQNGKMLHVRISGRKENAVVLKRFRGKQTRCNLKPKQAVPSSQIPFQGYGRLS